MDSKQFFGQVLRLYKMVSIMGMTKSVMSVLTSSFCLSSSEILVLIRFNSGFARIEAFSPNGKLTNLV